MTLLLAIRGISLRPSKVPIGSIPGPTLFRARAAEAGSAAGAGKWLCLRVRMAMAAVVVLVVVVVGGGMAVLSVNTGGLALDGLERFTVPGLRVPDWLKRRMNELLRDGRESAWPVVKGCMLDAVLLGGAVLLKLPGAGKSLRAGS